LYPVNWNKCVSELLDKPYDNYKTIIREYQPLIVLVNSVYKKLESITEYEILNGNMPINYFIKKSIENKGINKSFENKGINKSFENKGIIKKQLYTEQYIYVYNNNDYISNSIIYHKCWEPNISNIFDNIIKTNINNKTEVIDIGCNIGYYSLICAKNKDISKIYSIDANIDNINMLNMSCIANKITKINPINLAIADKLNENYYPSNKDFAQKIGNIGGLKYVKTLQETTENILSTTIDELVKINKINDIIIMKIDIEGGELNALKGASKTLNENIIKNIIIEILQILKKNNYNIYNIPHNEVGKYNSNINFLDNILKYPIIDINQFVKKIHIQTNILAIKKINTKYIIYTDWIENYLTKEHFNFIKNLEILGWELIKKSQLNIEKIKNTKCIVLCVTYDDFDISLIKCDNVKLIYKIDDLYPFKEIRRKCIANADIIISPYQYLFNTDDIKKYYGNIQMFKTFHIPYSAVNDFFNNINFINNPKNKIFVSGYVDNRYPLRKFIKTSYIFQEYIDFIDHPSYGVYKHNIINDIYYRKLNEYICCFVDASTLKYVLKVFEICSVGSLLLVEDSISEELNKLGFYDNINCIFCNITNLETKIKWILDIKNKNLIDNMRKLGMELVRSKHTTKNRAEQFNNIVIEILQNENLEDDNLNKEIF
jgi:FkbM family methyltransferase